MFLSSYFYLIKYGIQIRAIEIYISEVDKPDSF
ncbi:MAG: hypothetical protein RI980_828 [Bacteroidota bacterium]|jgi:hypothetical protein